MFNFLFCSFLRPPSTFPASSETVLGSGRLSAARRSRFGRSAALAWAPCRDSFVQLVCLSLSKSVKYRLNSLPGPQRIPPALLGLATSGHLEGPKIGSKMGPILGSLLDEFWVPKWAPVPKLIQKFKIVGSIFGSLCFDVLELFRGLLGALLGLLRLSSEASGAQKP